MCIRVEYGAHSVTHAQTQPHGRLEGKPINEARCLPYDCLSTTGDDGGRKRWPNEPDRNVLLGELMFVHVHV